MTIEGGIVAGDRAATGHRAAVVAQQPDKSGVVDVEARLSPFDGVLRQTGHSLVDLRRHWRCLGVEIVRRSVDRPGGSVSLRDVADAIVRLWGNAWTKFVSLFGYDVETRRAIKARGHVPSEQTRTQGPLPRHPIAGHRARRARWTMRWKPALNAFAITVSDRFPSR